MPSSNAASTSRPISRLRPIIARMKPPAHQSLPASRFKNISLQGIIPAIAVHTTQPPMAEDTRRRIRSFVRREGRLTPGQQRNLERLWPVHGLAMPARPLDWDRQFGRTAPRTLEIGFGAGEALAELAVAHPQRDFIGIEVYRNGVGRLLGAVDRAGARNVRVFCAD